MKIAFCNRPSWNSPLGGDGVQMLKTKEAIEKLYSSVEIHIITSPDLLDSTYSIIHIYNFVTTEITGSFFTKAISLKVPIVSSSIFWDYTYAWDRLTNLFVNQKLSQTAATIIEFICNKMAIIVGYPYFFSSKFKRKIEYFVNSSNIVLPNSIEERDLLLKFINKENLKNKFRVVYNAADNTSDEICIEKEELLKTYSIPDNYILQVGRIEPVKNQINVVYSLKDNPEIPIVFLGKISNKSYYKKLKTLSDKRGNVYFIDAVPHHLVKSFYKYAALHVLLSLRESPGLVSIEALNQNCPIVISEKRFVPVDTYFNNQRYIVNPFDTIAIRETLIKAYNERLLCKDGIEKFSWEVAAKQTYSAYLELI